MSCGFTIFTKEAGKGVTLRSLLFLHQRLQSSDPRDKVYASLSMTTDRDVLGIRPDYSSQSTVKDVYPETIVRIIQHEKTLDVLSGVNMQIRYQDEPLTGWVADWSVVEVVKPNNVLYGGPFAHRNVRFEASGKSSAQPSFNADRTDMTVRGQVIDALITVDTNCGDDQDEFSVTYQLACVERTVLLVGNLNYNSADRAREALILSLIYGSFDNSYVESVIWNDRSLHRVYDTWLFHKSRYGPVHVGEKQSLVNQFDVRVGWTSGGRPLGVTSNGYICILQSGMQPGDVIAVLE